MTNAAKETCRRMIEETEKRADILLEMAQQQALEIIARAHEGTPTGEGRGRGRELITTQDRKYPHHFRQHGRRWGIALRS